MISLLSQICEGPQNFLYTCLKCLSRPFVELGPTGISTRKPLQGEVQLQGPTVLRICMRGPGTRLCQKCTCLGLGPLASYGLLFEESHDGGWGAQGRCPVAGEPRDNGVCVLGGVWWGQDEHSSVLDSCERSARKKAVAQSPWERVLERKMRLSGDRAPTFSNSRETNRRRRRGEDRTRRRRQSWGCRRRAM